MHRRGFLRSGLIGAAALGLPRLALPQRASPVVEAIAPGLLLVRAAANGLVHGAAGDKVLLDAPAPDFEGSAALYGPAPTLFNSNWRPEHTAANDALGLAGHEIIAHENTKLWMGNDFTVAWEERRYAPRPPHALPNATFYGEGALDAGGETIEFGHLAQAHTDGDIYVFFRDVNVLAVSDLLAVAGFPVLDYSTGGWIGGLRSATEALLALADEDTIVVPAQGDPQTRRALVSQLELCEVALAAVGQAYAKAWSLEEFLAARPLDAFTDERGDPSFFLELVYKGAWGHIRELGVGIV